MSELKIIDVEVFDYGTSLGVKLSDGQVLRFTASSLVEAAPAEAAYLLEKVQRDNTELHRQLAAARAN